jgi:hypothetical protein
MAELRHSNRFGTKSGATGAAYVEIMRADLRGMGAQGKFIGFLKNTHVSSTMFYKVDLYLSGTDQTTEGQLTKAGKVETSIGANTQIEITTTEVPYNCIVVVSVKQNSAAGTYQYDWTTF